MNDSKRFAALAVAVAAISALLFAARPARGQTLSEHSVPLGIHVAVRAGISSGLLPGFLRVGDMGAFETAVQLSRRWSGVEWTALDVSALFPDQGGFVRLATGANVFRGDSYAGAGAGISRFDPNQSFLLLRLGHVERFGTIPVRLEARYEYHARASNGGNLLLVSAALQVH